MILVVPIVRRLLKAIDKSRLVRLPKMVFSGKRHFTNYYWVNPMVPPAPGKRISDAVKQAMDKCWIAAMENGRIENAFKVDRWGKIEGPIWGEGHSVYLGNERLPGGVIVHYHTQGKSFTIDDLEVYFAKRLSEIVILTQSGGFVFRADKRLWVKVISAYEDAMRKSNSVNAAMELVANIEGVHYADFARE